MPAVTAASRRAQRVIESESEEDIDDLDEEMDVDSELPSESEVDSPAPTPPTIRLRVPPSSRKRGGRTSTRAAAITASARAAEQARAKEEEEEEDEEEEIDELEDEEEAEEIEDEDMEGEGEGGGEGEGEEDDEDEGQTESRATSPTKMTARQRARLHDTDQHLMALPDGTTKAKPELTEAERLQKREEMARRRKRQNEQRLQDEQDQTINRLLRAQTGRSRSKLDDTETPRSGQVSPVKQRPVVPDGVRWVSRMKGDSLVLSVGVKAGREDWISLGGPGAREDGARQREGEEEGRGRIKLPNEDTSCAVTGCNQPRKYRCVSKTSVGGCSLAHLKDVEAQVRAGSL